MSNDVDDLTLEPDEVETEDTEKESSDCFFSPARRRLVRFLDIRFFDGDSMGIPYTHMDAILFFGNGITIISPIYRMRLEGRNLKILYQRLLTESVVWIRELPEEMEKLEASAVAVNKIRFIDDDEFNNYLTAR